MLSFRPVFLSLFLLASAARAQESLSFRQCVDLAKKNNAELASAQAAVESKRYQTQSLRGSYFPQITGSLGYLQSGPQDVSNSSAGTSYSATLTATQNLFNGFVDVAKVNQADAQTRSLQASLVNTQAKVSYDLKTAFASVLYAKDTEKVAKDFQKRREDNLRMVELRFESGRENKGSLLLSQAYLKQAKLDLLKAKNARLTSSQDLRRVLGETQERDIDVRDDLPLAEPSEQSPDFQGILVGNPSRRQSVADLESSQAALEIAKAGFFPSLNLTGSVGKAAEDFFPDKDRWSVGATLSWPLFGGGKDYYSTKSASSTFYAAQNTLSAVERQTLSNLKKAYTAYVEAVEEFKVNEAFLMAAKSRAEIARAKYNNGLMTFDEWDIIENDLINKTKIYLQTKRDRIIAEAAWEQAQGVGVFHE